MPTLDYATGIKAPPPRWLYWLAVAFCGWPAVAGVGITLLYLLTWWGALPIAGLLCILAGLLSVVVAVVLLAIYAVGQWRYGTSLKGRLWKEIGLAALLLMVDFPLAIGCMVVGDGETRKAQVTFVNETTSPVTAVTLISNGVPTVVGDVPAKSQRKFTMRVTQEAEFKGSATTGGVSTQFMIESYPEGGPMRKTVRFQTPATQPVVE